MTEQPTVRQELRKAEDRIRRLIGVAKSTVHTLKTGNGKLSAETRLRLLNELEVTLKEIDR